MQIQGSSPSTHIAVGPDEIDRLRTELQQLRVENAALLERQRAVMMLVGANQPDKIIHDIRNILNERNLLRTLTALGED